MANRLAGETSPYLLQHAHNPVDWYPWGEEAFARARAEDRPVLLSIGYAACHWCHVMERESFEDEGIARVMNELFVSVKVDREERPDVDAIYMQAVQAMTGHGGWPMTVFLTPEGEPFYGGTYFPPADRHGMPSFRRVLLSVADAWQTRREGVAKSAAALRQMYDEAERATAPTGQLSAELLARAERAIASRYDARHGGLEGAPKFPQTMAMEFLLTRWARTGEESLLGMAVDTFRAMARGGIYDQVGGGFARYSVDAVWLVPHFEKMLYDNALLVRLGVHLWQAAGGGGAAGGDGSAATAAEVRRVTAETLAWVAREMTAPSGGFYSTLDADSEGHEGKFYLWDEGELDALLGDDAPAVKRYWGVSAGGNFEGRNILHVHQGWPAPAAEEGGDPALAAAVRRAREVLYAARARRVWPARDEKILASWNGLMLRAAADAARAWGEEAHRALALRDAEFLASTLVDPDTGRVTRVHKDGVTRVPGFLEDHAAVALGFLAVYELTLDRRWLALARRVGGATVEWFWDDAAGAFYDTARDHERLVTRPRDVFDNATPSGTSLAVELLLRLAELDADADLRRRAGVVLETLAEPMARYAPAFGHLLTAADLAVYGAVEVALVGDPGDAGFQALAAEVGRRYVPSLVLAGGAPAAGGDVALLADRPAIDGRATGYVCRHYACERPATDAATLGAQLDQAARPGRAVG